MLNIEKEQWFTCCHLSYWNNLSLWSFRAVTQMLKKVFANKCAKTKLYEYIKMFLKGTCHAHFHVSPFWVSNGTWLHAYTLFLKLKTVLAPVSLSPPPKKKALRPVLWKKTKHGNLTPLYVRPLKINADLITKIFTWLTFLVVQSSL